MTRLRLILGDQLNPQHSWLKHPDPDVIYTLMEIRQETDYVLHHAQKILAIFAAMRDFAGQLTAMGHRVHYLNIGDSNNLQSLTANLDQLIAYFQADQFEYQLADEWRLDQQLQDYCLTLTIQYRACDSEHFFSSRRQAAEFFGSRSRWLMESFYRQMRIQHQILMENQKPVGGRWNFDSENRKPWSGSPSISRDQRKSHDHSLIWQAIVDAGVNSLGDPQAEDFRWPLNRTEALQQLEHFIVNDLQHFGDYQDAMSRQSWRLFHSLLSFALNCKMLNPREVVLHAEAAWRDGRVPLAAAEGFIRQILGWREYVRGIYWANMPTYTEHNHFGHTRPLPKWFWNAETKMNCLAASIDQTLQTAYAHHIQRLMIIGNFALLSGLDPKSVHHWYLGVYIDAFEWVELPNTLGMSQYADGGLLATKPYVSSAAYIDRMSDYCKGCHYQKKLRTGERACPFNALYWQFFIHHKPQLAQNHRLSMVFRQLERFSDTERVAIHDQAQFYLNHLDTL